LKYFTLPPLDQIYAAAGHLVRILVILMIAWITGRLIQKWFPRLRTRIVAHMVKQRGGHDIELEKRAATLSAIIRNTLSIIIWILAIIMALKEGGFDIGPILAGAGVVGLAVGFGAQTLVQDVISGMFMLLENQIRVNDVAVLNGTGGLVEAINLRTTVLRGQDGTVHVFRNGTINTLSNMSHGYSYYVFDIGVAYKEDTDRVIEVVKGIADNLMKEEPFNSIILAPLEVLGVDKFADSAVIVKARFKTAPIQQWTVGREMNRRIKKKFDEVGIEIPFPHTSIYFGEASKPFQLRIEGPEGEQLKEGSQDGSRDSSIREPSS
jgi:small conductance mechanosensitive channel